jgi:thiol-disulfide isomerase/thioredoxin
VDVVERRRDLGLADAEDYLASWGSLASMIVRGRSLSGHERNCAFLNPGPAPDGALRRFADVSAASGLDLVEDSRAISAGDWDGDGDLDLWLTNREAPRVRFLRNNRSEGPPSAWVSFALEGTTSNRDAIGAVVTFEFGGRALTRTVAAGDGFLSQSSKRLFFGLGPLGSDRTSGTVTVRWPGGAPETLEAVEINRVHRIVQGRDSTEVIASPATPSALTPSAPTPAPSTEKARLILTERLEAPAIEFVDFGGELAKYDPATAGAATLINLWASWCLPCVAELADFKEHAAFLQRKGLKIIALTTEAVSADGTKPDISAAKDLVKRNAYPFTVGATDALGLRLLTVLHNSVVVLEHPLPLPTSFLFDRHGRLAAVYKGPVSAAQLTDDLTLLDAAPAVIAQAAFPFPSQAGFEHFGITHLHFAKAYRCVLV